MTTLITEVTEQLQQHEIAMNVINSMNVIRQKQNPLHTSYTSSVRALLSLLFTL
jgi:hypothetical protein